MPNPALNALLEETIDTLQQLETFVSTLPAGCYNAPHGADARHSIGKHIRHILDHYEALLAARLDTMAVAIDYEHRRRDPDLERHPEVALEHLHHLRERLTRLEQHDTAAYRQHLTYRAGDHTLSLSTSLERELAFLTSHAIHHMAIIALLADTQGIEVSETFGVHPSTQRHWQDNRPVKHEVPS
ncbi:MULTISPECIES: DinB family protein [Halomonadaceae]|uniref:DinB family protein n=1 Tax=Halomonadaceae TaxID=28256 RepID=UPI00158152BA|nr:MULTISPECIES: DinB family protein [Halomonas]MDI4636797.1 DinB family protein [Halomonas sp. BMC7]NUJ61159.1 DinB family protein [Halomonas taeanensis]